MHIALVELQPEANVLPDFFFDDDWVSADHCIDNSKVVAKRLAQYFAIFLVADPAEDGDLVVNRYQNRK